jgi:hypothetical protein
VNGIFRSPKEDDYTGAISPAVGKTTAPPYVAFVTASRSARKAQIPVRLHIEGIYGKFHVQSRAQAVARMNPKRL